MQPSSPYILVVDDEEDIREIISTVLELEGIPVLTAQNGRDALNKLKQTTQPPALILLDLMMPEMDGFGFIENLRQGEVPHAKSAPIIVVTAFSQKETPAGAAGLLTKPVPLDKLISVVKEYVKS